MSGVRAAKKVKKSELPFEFTKRSDNVIGLDFGTSTLAISYVTSSNSIPTNIKIHPHDLVYYAPTILLIDELKAVDIGSTALRRYTDLEIEVTRSIFFEKVKLELQHNKVCIFTL